MIGLTRNKVEIVSYSATWPDIFKLERDKLMVILGVGNVLDIQHVGSTSIPHMEAKPIIDIAIAVENFEEAKKLVEPMVENGYTYRGENGIPRRHFFIKYSDEKSLFHVHMNEVTSKDWIGQIYFRDYLRTHENKCKEYIQLKNDLAKEFPLDREAYTKGKNDFIQSILSTKTSSNQ